MGTTFLEKGQMLTGRFGRRYMVKSFIDGSEKVQFYELTESGKTFVGVAILNDSARMRAEFVEKASDVPNKANEYCWPIDVFSFETQHKKCVGYVAENVSGKNFAPFKDNKTITMKQRYKIAYNVAKSFSKLHLQRYVYNEVPEIWVDDQLNVRLMGLPVPEGSRFTNADIMGQLGISAPEFFATAAAKEGSVYADRFTMASMLFKIIVGINPYVELSKDPNYAYARFVFSKEVKDPIEDYGYDTVERFAKLDDKVRSFFIKDFIQGYNDPLIRVDETDWAHALGGLIE